MAFDQKTKEHGNKMLDMLIKMSRDAAIDACKHGDIPDADPAFHAGRDKLYYGEGLLLQVKSIFGSIEAPDITTKAGSK